MSEVNQPNSEIQQFPRKNSTTSSGGKLPAGIYHLIRPLRRPALGLMHSDLEKTPHTDVVAWTLMLQGLLSCGCALYTIVFG